MSSSSSSSSSSTHQDSNLAPALNTTKNKPRTSKFIEGPMLDEPSQPPPRQLFDKHSSARSSSETKGTDARVARTTYRHLPRSASEPLEVSSPKTMEVRKLSPQLASNINSTKFPCSHQTTAEK
ncbi:uncharacterized protein Bfra_003345 [Botrytis fragariae]|uniref:Uncharacterized protein n=1 Tax=Botrytis fragariae TaxID=1964551 RepID=A0A8H6AWQ7_9HELO|nr:uncharacterized protein Bfra_003345 [Botrytis fragariae]KAF5874894.1 hypothetical protein Bfra_003345 [Botrytis fragariae]